MNNPAGLAALPAAIENAVTTRNGEPVTTSLKIAEVFGKKHNDVVRRIQALEIPPEWGMRNFAQTQYTHPQNGQKYQMFYVTRDGFTLLAMGFTGARAMAYKLAYIERFNAMEKTLKGAIQYSVMAAITDMANAINALKNQVTILANRPAVIRPPMLSNAEALAMAERLRAGLKKGQQGQGQPGQAEALKRWNKITVETCRRIIRALDARYNVTGMKKAKAVAILEKIGCTAEKAAKMARTISK